MTWLAININFFTIRFRFSLFPALQTYCEYGRYQVWPLSLLGSSSLHLPSHPSSLTPHLTRRCNSKKIYRIISSIRYTMSPPMPSMGRRSSGCGCLCNGSWVLKNIPHCCTSALNRSGRWRTAQGSFLRLKPSVYAAPSSVTLPLSHGTNNTTLSESFQREPSLRYWVL